MFFANRMRSVYLEVVEWMLAEEVQVMFVGIAGMDQKKGRVADRD